MLLAPTYFESDLLSRGLEKRFLRWNPAYR